MTTAATEKLTHALQMHWACTCNWMDYKQGEHHIIALPMLPGFGAFRSWDGRYGIVNLSTNTIQASEQSTGEENRMAFAEKLSSLYATRNLIRDTE